MTNSDAGDELYYEILNSVNDEYGWISNYTVLYTVILVIVIIAAVVLMLRRRKSRRGLD